jgi:glycosyltransferase involved in cell wall biosynthesis
VTVVHDVIPLAFPREFPRQQWYFRRFVPAILRQSRAVVVGSEATRRDVIAAYDLAPGHVTTVPYGFDSTHFRADGVAVDDGPLPYLLYVGNVLPHKNLPRLVDAFARAARVVPARLVLVAGGRFRGVKRLEALAKRSGAPVEIRRYLPYEELPAWYRGARALVSPSLAEGFGLPALEAMACGTPVIASNVSSLPEVVGDAGLLVDPTDTDAIADAMVRLLTDDSLRSDLKARGLERAAHFSWDSTAREMLMILDQVAASR